MAKKQEQVEVDFGKVPIGKIIFTVFLVFLVITGLGGAVYSVEKGEHGCEFSKATGWKMNEEEQGWHLKIPIVESVDTMSFRTKTLGLHSGGEGQQTVLVPKDKNGINFKVDVTLRYRLDKAQICEFIEQKGKNPETVLLTALRADSTRGIFGQYAQEDVPEARIEIAGLMAEKLQERLNKEASGALQDNFIIVEAVDIRNIQFDTRIEEAIVNKQTRKQEAEKQTYILQQAEKEREIAIVQADAKKQAQILEAQGRAEAILVEATAKAEGTRLVNEAFQSMPPQYVEVKYAEALKSVAEGGNSVFMDIGRFQGGSNLGIMDYTKLVPTLQSTGTLK